MIRDNFNMVTTILAVWTVISVIVLSMIGWNYLEGVVFKNGLQEGAAAASGQIYTDIINKSANNDCNTVFVQYEGRRVDLINVQCLQVEEAPAASDPASEDGSVPNS